MDVVKYLSESGADINKADNDGFTPVNVAALNVRTRISHYDLTCIRIGVNRIVNIFNVIVVCINLILYCNVI